jgi:hypothetical protein
MEETTGGLGPQLYVLTQDDYAELCNIRSMLIQMAREAYDEEKPDTADQRLVMTRSEIHYVFIEISAQIHDVLIGVRRQNVAPPRGGSWQ